MRIPAFSLRRFLWIVTALACVFAINSVGYDGPIGYVDPFVGVGYYIYGKSYGWPLVYRSESMTGEFDWMEPWWLAVNISIKTLFLFLAIAARGAATIGGKEGEKASEPSAGCEREIVFDASFPRSGIW
jgi:hypothetical protein